MIESRIWIAPTLCCEISITALWPLGFPRLADEQGRVVSYVHPVEYMNDAGWSHYVRQDFANTFAGWTPGYEPRIDGIVKVCEEHEHLRFQPIDPDPWPGQKQIVRLPKANATAAECLYVHLLWGRGGPVRPGPECGCVTYAANASPGEPFREMEHPLHTRRCPGHTVVSV